MWMAGSNYSIKSKLNFEKQTNITYVSNKIHLQHVKIPSCYGVVDEASTSDHRVVFGIKRNPFGGWNLAATQEVSLRRIRTKHRFWCLVRMRRRLHHEDFVSFKDMTPIHNFGAVLLKLQTSFLCTVAQTI